MATANITKRAVDAATAGSADSYLWDRETCRFRPEGHASRPQGLPRAIPVGRPQRSDPANYDWGSWGADANSSSRRGQTPARRDCRRTGPRGRARQKKGDKSLAAVFEQFIAEHVRPKLKASTAREYERTARIYIVPRLGRRPIAELKRADIARLHHELASTPYQANRTLALLSKLFAWAEKHGLRPEGSNPCRHIEKYRESRRERFLSQAELGRLGDALREAEPTKAARRGSSLRSGC